MLGQLPRALEVGGKQYKIRTDYRVILRVLAAATDPELTDEDKVLVCFANIYEDWQSLPQTDLREAYEQALHFIEAGRHSEHKGPKLMDWTRDEDLIFPAVNQAAGKEVRELEYLHWWTFMGYFQSIDRESLFGTVLHIRQKRKKHKKLEGWEQEFYNNNRELCDLKDHTDPGKSAEDQLQRIFEQLLHEGGEDIGG